MGSGFKFQISVLLVVAATLLSACMAERYYREGLWVVDDYVRTVRNQRGYKLAKQGGPHYSNERLSELKLQFCAYETADRRQARKIAVEMTEDLLDAFNKNEVAHPCGARRPITTHNIDLTIRFESFFGSFVNPKTILYVNVRDGYVTYFGYDCLCDPCNCTSFREPYDEAFRTVQRIHEMQEREEAAQETKDRQKKDKSEFNHEWGIPLN